MLNFLRRRLETILIVAIVGGIWPATAAMWNWSTTAANNASADPTINWSEGMAPSSVNDSARAMMAALAAWRNDISGVNLTAGSSTVYTLTTSEGVNTTPVSGQMVAFYVHATNGTGSTLTVDGGNTYPIYLNNAAAPGGTLIAGSPYRVSYDGSGHWALESGYANPYSVPVGGLLPYTGTSPPNSNFIFPVGQCLSTTTYAAYWAILGSPASGACPGGQFQVVDLRGRVPAMLDGLGGQFSGASRLTTTGCGTTMQTVGAVCSLGLEARFLTVAQMPGGIPVSVTGTFSGTTNASGGGFILGNAVTSAVGGGAVGAIQNPVFFSQIPVSGSITGSGTANGSGNSTPSVQPTIGVTYLLRVL